MRLFEKTLTVAEKLLMMSEKNDTKGFPPPPESEKMEAGAGCAMEESARNPLAIIPDECWELVLNQIKDPADLLNCYRTCQLWKDILNSSLTTWVFPAVFAKLVQYLNTADLLNCRQVSKSWKATIDHHLEEGQFQLSYSSLDDICSRHCLELSLDTTNRDKPSAKVEKFIQQMGDSVGNPIVGREVLFVNFPDHVVEFLEKFGPHVWHLTLNLFEEGNTIAFLTGLHKCLSRAPNLRSLKIIDDSESRELEQVAGGVLERFFAENLLPQLPHLHYLKLHLYSRLTDNSAPVETQLMSAYASNLQKFKVWQSDYNNLIPPSAPNLTHLNCDVFSDLQWNALRRLDSPLQILKLNIIDDYADLNDAFRTAEHFSQTLKFLSVSFSRNDVEAITLLPDRIHLPPLERLELQDLHTTSLMTFDFLEDLLSLRWLELNFSSYDKVDGGEQRVERVVINEHLGRNGVPTTCGMYLSNIWTLLPSLQRISFTRFQPGRGWVGDTVFSREWYVYLYANLGRMNIM